MTTNGCNSCHEDVELPQTIVAVNEIEIGQENIRREVQNHPAPSAAEAWQMAAQALVVRELLRQEATRLTITGTPKRDSDGRLETMEEASLRELIDNQVMRPRADEATCRRYYEQNPTRFRSPDVFEASHILLAARRDDRAAYAQALKKAREIIGLLENNESAFPELAKVYSDCASARDGGNLGQVTRQTITPEFAAALLAQGPGEISRQPVETSYGVHVIQLHRRIAGRLLPFESVCDRISDYLTERCWRQSVAQYLFVLASQADIKGVELPTAEELRLS